MLPIIRIFGLSFQAPLLALLAAYAFALSVTSRMASRAGLKGGAISDAGFYGAIIGYIGARVGYALMNLDAYAREPLSALMPSTSALNPSVGVLAGLAFAGYYLWRRQALNIALLDALAYGLPIMLVGIALADLANGDSLGAATQVPWAIYLWDEMRHPVQLYECLALCIVLVMLLLLRGKSLPIGARILLVIGMYAMSRVIIDGFRIDAALIATLRITQLAGVLVAATAFWMIGELVAHKRPQPDLTPSE